MHLRSNVGIHMEQCIGRYIHRSKSSGKLMGKSSTSSKFYPFMIVGGGVWHREYGHGEIFQRFIWDKLLVGSGVWHGEHGHRETYERFFFDNKRYWSFF